VYRNNHTTSTKCQYHAAASNLKWWLIASCPLNIRIKLTAKNAVPISTWSPWNPVDTKKVLPIAPSEIENWDSKYSKACRIEKYTPSEIVIRRALNACPYEPPIRLWWAQVMDTPDANKIVVFKRGT